MSVPSKMKALITEETKTVKVEEIPVPEIDENDVLVKNEAIALNPTDWKHVHTVTNAGSIVGCDFAGTIARVGKNITSLAVGDRVAGFTQGGTWNDVGAFAEYSRTPGDLVWKIPSTLTQEQAATLGCAYWTAVQALFAPGRLGLIEPPAKVTESKWIFIYGASTSVGLYAIQLAHLAGYKIVATASPKNHELAKSLGADVVLDYKDPDVVNKIKQVTGDSIHLGFDTVSLESSQDISIKSFASGPGKLLVILAPSQAAQAIRPDVPIQVTLIYTALGRAFNYRGSQHPVIPEDRGHMVEFLKKTPELVTSGAVKPNPVKLWPGGLESVKDGLDYLKEGKNSGEKVVYRIA